MQSNGTASAGALTEYVDAARATRDQVAASVRELLATEERLAEQLQRQAEEARYRRDHLRKALEHLLAEPGQPVTAKAKPKPPALGAQRSYRPKPHNLEAVLKALRACEEPATMGVLVEATGLSGETVSRAVRALREDGLVRVVRTGVSGMLGKGTTYAAMPPVTIVDDEEAARRGA